MSFTVKTQSFEGPLDLLLDLIEKKRHFISHVRRFENLPMAESAHFILIASILLLIKSRSLLPELSLTEEEKGDILDLEIRLKIFKRIKEASRRISELFGRDIIFPQSRFRHVNPIFTPDSTFTLEMALYFLKDLVNRLPKKENLPKHIVQKVISLEEMIANLTTRITTSLRMSFKQFTAEHKGEKVGIIVSFLAMLELVKEGIVQVNQEKEFDDIVMETKEVGVPRY